MVLCGRSAWLQPASTLTSRTGSAAAGTQARGRRARVRASPAGTAEPCFIACSRMLVPPASTLVTVAHGSHGRSRHRHRALGIDRALLVLSLHPVDAGLDEPDGQRLLGVGPDQVRAELDGLGDGLAVRPSERLAVAVE